MSEPEPVTKADLKETEQVLLKAVEGNRTQNSIEHGSLFTKMTHLGNLMGWLKDAWRRFSILPPPPDEDGK